MILTVRVHVFHSNLVMHQSRKRPNKVSARTEYAELWRPILMSQKAVYTGPSGHSTAGTLNAFTPRHASIGILIGDSLAQRVSPLVTETSAI
jgi:hypothetical protein